MAASYRYSHRNLRIERTDKAGTVRYVFDLDGNIIEEHRGDELIRYVFRRGKHLAKITPDGTYYYGTDRLGSTTVMFDGEGSVVWRGDVSPFGELVSSEGSIEERVKFTGKDYDEAAGLYYFNARWYDAELGRFTTEDPARDGLNWYVYVRNNPMKYTDPTGLWAGVDDIFTGPVDEIVVIGGLALLAWLGIEPANDALESLSEILKNTFDNIFRRDGDTEDKNNDRDIDDINNPDEWPENPDDWEPPEDVTEEEKTKDATDGRHRQWKNKDGETVRRWDETGREAGKDRGPHWHDRQGRHIIPPEGGVVE